MKSKIGTTIIIVFLLLGIAGMFYFNWQLFQPSDSVAVDYGQETPLAEDETSDEETPTPEPEPEELYENSFAADSDFSADFDDPVDTGTNDSPSSWEVDGGKLVQSSNIWGGTYGKPAEGHQFFGTYVLTEKDDFADFDMEVTIVGNDDDGMGLVFRADDKSYYRVLAVLSESNGGPFLLLDKKTLKNNEPTFTVLKTKTWSYEQGEEYVFRIQADGADIKVWINDTLQLTATDESNYLKEGAIGFYSYGQKGLSFDDLKITEVGGLAAKSEDGTPAAIIENEEVTANTNQETLEGELAKISGGILVVKDEKTSKNQDVQIIDVTKLKQGSESGKSIDVDDLSKGDVLTVLGKSVTLSDGDSIFLAEVVVVNEE